MNPEIEDIKNPIDIRTLRDKYNLSQEMLARMLGASIQSVVRWEDGAIPSSIWKKEIRRLKKELEA